MQAGVWPGTANALAVSAADGKCLAVTQQMVELVAVGAEFGLRG
jgi:hypothetical protein